MKSNMVIEEFVLGGIATCGAGLFTNPLEVVKTRMQLQGELKSRGQYHVHYRNVFHAFMTIARADGILGLQKGLVPALYYQFLMNGIRLGSYQAMVNLGLLDSDGGQLNFCKSVLGGAIAGCVGAFCGSPVYMIKTHLQAQSAANVAVGYQRTIRGFHSAFWHTYVTQGVYGLWRGVTGAMPRVSVGSAVQLSTFSKSLQLVNDIGIFQSGSLLNTLIASFISGAFVVTCMTPFDVVSTRLYNQPIDEFGRGLFYNGFMDCFPKIAQTEGFLGFYKGIGPSLFRLGPHTVLSLVMWQECRKYYNNSIKRL